MFLQSATECYCFITFPFSSWSFINVSRIYKQERLRWWSTPKSRLSYARLKSRIPTYSWHCRLRWQSKKLLPGWFSSLHTSGTLSTLQCCTFLKEVPSRNVLLKAPLGCASLVLSVGQSPDPRPAILVWVPSSVSIKINKKAVLRISCLNSSLMLSKVGYFQQH